MIKECRILMNNDSVTVTEYDGVKIQFPSIHKQAEFVNVEKRGNEYFIVEDKPIKVLEDKVIDAIDKKSKKEPVEVIEEKPKKKGSKKTTLEESVKDNDAE